MAALEEGAIAAFTQKVHRGKIHRPEAPRFTDLFSMDIGGLALGPELMSDPALVFVIKLPMKLGSVILT